MYSTHDGGEKCLRLLISLNGWDHMEDLILGGGLYEKYVNKI